MKSQLDYTVSVIIPTFNRPEQVIRAIESALSQSHKPIEIIVVDDGSDESFKKELRSLAKLKKFIFIEFEHTGNPGLLRKVGVEKANGHWVAFLDDDDFWHPQKLEAQLRVAEKANVGFLSTLCNSSSVTMKSLEFEKIGLKKLTRRSLYRQNAITNSSVMAKKSLLMSVGGYAHSHLVVGAEDYATWLRLCRVSKHVMISEELTFYNNSDSIDHLSKRDTNRFMQYFGLFDYVNWALNNSKSRFVFFRLFLRLARKFI
jgi:glycosyltransferase involved in cell wall biosynthesis